MSVQSVEFCNVGLPSFMEEHPWTLIPSEDALASELRKQGEAQPHIAQIRCQQTRFISIGVGGNWMYIEVYPNGIDNDSLLYVPAEGQAGSPVVFLFQGIPDALPAKYLVPLDKGIALVLRLVYGDEIPDGFVHTRDQRIQDEQLIKSARKALIPEPKFDTGSDA